MICFFNVCLRKWCAYASICLSTVVIRMLRNYVLGFPQTMKKASICFCTQCRFIKIILDRALWQECIKLVNFIFRFQFSYVRHDDVICVWNLWLHSAVCRIMTFMSANGFLVRLSEVHWLILCLTISIYFIMLVELTEMLAIRICCFLIVSMRI